MIVIKNNTREGVQRKLIELLEKTNWKINAVVEKRDDTLKIGKKAEIELIEMAKMMDMSNKRVMGILIVLK